MAVGFGPPGNGWGWGVCILSGCALGGVALTWTGHVCGSVSGLASCKVASSRGAGLGLFVLQRGLVCW